MASPNSHPPPGMRHLVPVHHERHPQDRQRAFERLYEHDAKYALAAKVAEKRMLAPIESLHRILEGNREHQRRVERFHATGNKMPQRINCLLLICADARLGGMFRFEDFAKEGIVPVYVAGNVSDVFKNREMAKLLGRLADNASVVIMGHSKCGAVHCAQEIGKFGAEKHRNIKQLLACVHHSDEGSNLGEQAKQFIASLEFRSVKKKGIGIACAFAHMDCEKPSVAAVSRVSREERAFISKISTQFEEANRKQNLSEKQYAHAIVISDPNYGFDAREIASCAANEIFCISAASLEGKHATASAEMALVGLLDEHAIASAEYSVTHNQTRHIVIVHPQHAQIEAQMIRESDIIRDAVLSGEVEITTMTYNPKTGSLAPVRHLVNQDATSIAV